METCEELAILGFGALVQWEHATRAVWRAGVQVPYAPVEKVLIFKAFSFLGIR